MRSEHGTAGLWSYHQIHRTIGRSRSLDFANKSRRARPQCGDIHAVVHQGAGEAEELVGAVAEAGKGGDVQDAIQGEIAEDFDLLSVVDAEPARSPSTEVLFRSRPMPDWLASSTSACPPAGWHLWYRSLPR